MAAIMSLSLILSAIALITGFAPMKNKIATNFEKTIDTINPIPDEETLQVVKHQPDNLALFYASLDPNCELNPESMKYVGNDGSKMWVDTSCFTEDSLTYLFRYLDIPLPNLMKALELKPQDDKPTDSSSSESASSESIDAQFDVQMGPTSTSDENPAPVNNPKTYIFRDHFNHL